MRFAALKKPIFFALIHRKCGWFLLIVFHAVEHNSFVRKPLSFCDSDKRTVLHFAAEIAVANSVIIVYLCAKETLSFSLNDYQRTRYVLILSPLYYEGNGTQTIIIYYLSARYFVYVNCTKL